MKPDLKSNREYYIKMHRGLTQIQSLFITLMDAYLYEEYINDENIKEISLYTNEDKIFTAMFKVDEVKGFSEKFNEKLEKFDVVLARAGIKFRLVEKTGEVRNVVGLKSVIGDSYGRNFRLYKMEKEFNSNEIKRFPVYNFSGIKYHFEEN